MHIGSLMLLAVFAHAAPIATQDTTQSADTLNPADTIPALELTDTAYFVQDACGADRARLDSCYVLLHDLLTVALRKQWGGEFSFEELAARYPKIREHQWFRPASFQLHPGRGAVYVSFMENEGFLPTIRLVNDPNNGLLEFSFSTSLGTSIAWAAPLQ